MKTQIVNSLIRTFHSKGWVKKKTESNIQYYYHNRLLDIKLICCGLFFYTIRYEENKKTREFKQITVFSPKIWLSLKIFNPITPEQKKKEREEYECLKKLEKPIGRKDVFYNIKLIEKAHKGYHTLGAFSFSELINNQTIE